MLPRLQIVYWGGEEFYLYLWLFSMFMLIFLMTVYPDYIAPLFDKYTPMPEGELLKISVDIKFGVVPRRLFIPALQ
jgi:hypothetical protein